MRVVRRRLFWKIYLTLLASLVAAIVITGAFFWFLGEARRDASGPTRSFGPADVSLYSVDGKLVAARGRPIALTDYTAGRHWGPGHVMRLDLPDHGIVLARFGPPGGSRLLRLVAVMLSVFGGIGLAVYPVTALLTRRLEALRAGVTRWGETAAPVRLDEAGSDEVALLAKTFNTAVARVDALLASQKALLANASHELRSPLARLRIAVEAGPNDGTREEIVQNLTEMDQLVDELLLSSRLDHSESRKDRRESIELLGLAAEEAARCGATATGEPVEIVGDAVLLRRLIRNLLENGNRHGRPPVEIAVAREGADAVISVSDGGDGIAAQDRERIFEPFYRPAGSAESAGGWGLGLALVRQIAERHGANAECGAAPSGGSRFVVRLGATRPPTD